MSKCQFWFILEFERRNHSYIFLLQKDALRNAYFLLLYEMIVKKKEWGENKLIYAGILYYMEKICMKVDVTYVISLLFFLLFASSMHIKYFNQDTFCFSHFFFLYIQLFPNLIVPKQFPGCFLIVVLLYKETKRNRKYIFSIT